MTFSQTMVFLPASMAAIWAVVLYFTAGKNDYPRRYLAAFMCAMTILYATYIPFFLGHTVQYINLMPLYTFMSLMIFPMYHYYIRYLVGKEEITWYKPLYLPAIVMSQLMLVCQVFFSADDYETAAHLFLVHFGDWMLDHRIFPQLFIGFYGLSRIIFMGLIIYTLISNLKIIRTFHKELESGYADPERHSLNKLNYINILIIAISVYNLLTHLIGIRFFFENLVLLTIPLFTITVLIFILGYVGYRTDLSLFRECGTEVQPVSPTPHDIQQELDIEELFRKNFIENKAYLIHDLKLVTLCEKMEINRTYLSNYINQKYQMNFCSLVNKFRVEESCRMLSDEAYAKYSMNYVAERCGFNSMNSFFRTFQKEYGITPGEFRKNQKSKI